MSPKTLMLLAGASLIVTGCASTKRELPDGPMNSGQNQGNNSANQGVIPGSQEDFVANISSDRVFFNTDRFDIDSEDAATLASQAEWLKRYPSVRVTIEGHCDERGTRDYNLALGERRANAAKNYLASLGIAAARISTISYGKERPDALGSDEASWARNRRAVSITVR
jgi:peptidoglycan-associated lipoprotein